jgi:hypothetical protein
MFNGGYQYDANGSGDWGSAGPISYWDIGTYNDTGNPGDLIASSGHIQMIVGKTDKSYIVAHASGWQYGILIVERPFKNTGDHDYRIVDMSNYYATHPRTGG